MPINNYFMQKIDKHPSTSNIEHQYLFGYIVSSEINQKCVLYVILMDLFLIFLTSAISNDITNIFVKSILVQKIAYTSIHDIIISPEHLK